GRGGRLGGGGGGGKQGGVGGGEVAPQPRAPGHAEGDEDKPGRRGLLVTGTLTLTNPGCDPAGFPNGRRPGDDTVDIALRVAMGYLLTTADAPSGQLGYTDAVLQSDAQFDAAFPYLTTPMPGAGAQ